MFSWFSWFSHTEVRADCDVHIMQADRGVFVATLFGLSERGVPFICYLGVNALQ